MSFEGEYGNFEFIEEKSFGNRFVDPLASGSFSKGSVDLTRGISAGAGRPKAQIKSDQWPYNELDL